MIDKIGIKSKQWMTKELSELLQDTTNVFIVRFCDLEMELQENIRSQMRGNNSSLMIVKNSICKRAFCEYEWNDLVKFIDGPTALVLGDVNPIKVAKVLVDFSDENPSFIVKGGVLDGEICSQDRLSELAELPSKEVLLGKLTGSLASPIINFIYILDVQVKRMVYVLSQIKKKKENESDK